MFELIQNAYDLIEKLSFTGLVAAAVIFTLAFLFAVREAASWFFKIDDIKKDIRKLSTVTLDLEAEVRLLQSLVTQAKEPLKNTKLTSTDASPALAKAPETKSPSFPINH